MSQYVKLTLAATAMAMTDAGIESLAQLPGATAGLLGSANGAPGFSSEFYQQIVAQGLEAANPLIFAEGVPNAASAHLSMTLGLTGPCQAIVGSRCAGLDALWLAVLAIRSGQCERVIVSAAEEHSEVIRRAYRSCGLHTAGDRGGVAFCGEEGFVYGSGAVTLVLESRAAAERRGAGGRAIVESGNGAAWVGQFAGPTIRRLSAMIRSLGEPAAVLTSASSTWIDRLEALAVAKASQGGPGAEISSIYGHIPECGAVTGLAGVAAVALIGRMPAARTDARAALAPGLRLSGGGEIGGPVTVLCTGFNHTMTAVRMRPGESPA